MSSAAPGTASASPEIVAYDFGRTTELTDDKLVFFRDAAGQIAVDAAEAINQWTPGYTLEVGPVDELAAGQSPFDGDDGHDLAPISAGGVPCGVLAVSEAAGLMLVSGTLGGSAKPEIEPRPLTSIEIRVLDLVTLSFLEVASKVLLLEEMSIERSTGAGFRGGDDTPKNRLRLSFTLQGARDSATFAVAIDNDALQQFTDAIERRLAGGRPTTPILPSPLTALALEPVPMFLTVGVGRAELTAREVVELQAGDVIRTRVPVTSELVASAGDKDLFAVRMVENGRRLMAEIVAPITAENQR